MATSHRRPTSGPDRPFGIYVHVPWCSSRCGYCDFNTYVPGALADANPNTFVADAVAELRFARRTLGDRDLPVETVFFGGGTPTLLPPADLVAVLSAIDSEFGLAPDAEVTTEANPESVSPQVFAELRVGGFTRISLGMQSAVPEVLAVLDREHSPGRAVAAAREAQTAGFEQVSLDLIYGTPGETDGDWQRSLDAVLDVRPSHVSAYSLIVEPGTRMARQVSRGELTETPDDVLAARYEMADDALAAAGLRWYEVSNWAADAAAHCRHNELYWHNDNWWGIGPGAHSHLDGVRWWNLKHPARYRAAVMAGQSPEAGREVLTPEQQQLEHIMLGIRLAEGLRLSAVPDCRRDTVEQLVTRGLVEPEPLQRIGPEKRIVLTARGRLLANSVITELTG